MRIGLVIYGSLDTISGGYLYDRKLVQYLQSQGEQVEIAALPWRSYPRHLGDNLSPSWRRRLRDLRVDVLLQDELNHPSLAWLNADLRRRVSVPLVSIAHHLRASEEHPAWAVWLYRMVERRYLRSVDAFIFNSETTRRAVQSLAGEEKPFVIAYPAGDQFNPQMTPDEITRRAHLPGPLRILFVGNLIPRKGLHVLLRSLSEIKACEWRLEIVGRQDADPAYARQMRRQAARLGMDGRVAFRGGLSAGELSAAYSRSHVLAVPSSYEGFGIVYLEAMSFGLPALATTSGAAGEIITHGVDGCLAPAPAARALGAYLSELCQDRQRLASMGLAARQRYLRHPTWQQTGQKIHQFLKELVPA
jgi:glycosyltransferase involved in cell wall biosynthesis